MSSTGVQIEFLGAAGTVTGSRSLIRFEGQMSLVDCGLFQGARDLRERNWQRFPVEPSKISRLYLTHAHLDHSGYIPKLVKEGFAGEIWCSEGTAELCEVLWFDSAKLQEEDAEFANKTKHSRHAPALPLYNRKDVEATRRLVRPKPRDEWLIISKTASLRMRRAGHIIGASFLEFQFQEGNGNRRICFSGDVGHGRSFTLREPADPDEADLLVLESTYGNRLHSHENILQDFEEALNRALSRKGVVVIPAFAVGRSQEVLKILKILESEKRIPSVPVILDSPMAERATEIYERERDDHRPGSIFSPDDGIFPKQFEMTENPDDSMMACMRDGPLIVISASGMLAGGRVLHHLKKRIQDPKNLILFVGYQAEGTKGRYLVDKGVKEGTIRIHHEEIPVRAEVVMVEGLSAHGDYQDLTKWVKKFRRPPKKIILNHGEGEALTTFQSYLKKEIGCEVLIARIGERYSL